MSAPCELRREQYERLKCTQVPAGCCTLQIWRDRTIWNLIGAWTDPDEYFPFRCHLTIRRGHQPARIDVHHRYPSIPQTNRIINIGLIHQIVLCHDVATCHSSSQADVKLIREIAAVGIFPATQCLLTAGNFVHDLHMIHKLAPDPRPLLPVALRIVGLPSGNPAGDQPFSVVVTVGP